MPVEPTSPAHRGVGKVDRDQYAWRPRSHRQICRSSCIGGDVMPHATPCLDCNTPTPSPRNGRCPRCRRERDRNDYYQSAEWRRIAAAAKRRGGGCAICGSTQRLVAHHSHARREGGPDQEDNIVLLCGAGAIDCNWQSCHSQYEADKRTGKDTQLRRLVEAL